MRFAQLNKPPPPSLISPPSLLSPPSNVLELNKPPGGLNRGFTALTFLVFNTKAIIKAADYTVVYLIIL